MEKGKKLWKSHGRETKLKDRIEKEEDGKEGERRKNVRRMD